MLLLGILVVALAIVGIIIYVHSRFEPAETKTQTESDQTAVQDDSVSSLATPNLVLNQMVTTGSGLQITKTVEGSGAAVTTVGSNVTVNYTGMFDNGKTFSSSIDPATGKATPIPFTLGVRQVIPGWDEGLMGMKVGEKRHLVIPSSLAYGPKGYLSIPGNATLTFDVQLVSIK